MKKNIVIIILGIITLFVAPLRVDAYVRTEPFLGLGLGWNIYNKADVDELGPAWVYNWTVPWIADKNPYVDFGKNYVPMVWGCAPGSNEGVESWIESAGYEGYVMYLNEPDNGHEGAGSNCPPATAVTNLAQFIEWKNNYKNATGRTIDIIFGGVVFGPDMPSARFYGEGDDKRYWLEEFILLWRAAYGTDPDIAGTHFHIYPWNLLLTDKDDILAHMKRRIEGGYDPTYQLTFSGWNDWYDQNQWAWGTKNQIWLTEVGLLEANIPKETVDYIFI